MLSGFLGQLTVTDSYPASLEVLVLRHRYLLLASTVYIGVF